MDNFSTFAMDFGLRPQGKAAPMSRSSNGGDRPPVFDDVYSAPKPYSSFSDFDYDSLFKTKNNSNTNTNNSNYNYNSSISDNRPLSPVYDKPVYDEDIFDGLPGVKAQSGFYDENVFATVLDKKQNRGSRVEKPASSGVGFDENVFATMPNEGLNRDRNHSVGFDDLLENLGKSEKLGSNSENLEGFDELLPGFGVTSPQRSSRSGSESSQSNKASVNSTKPTSSVMDNDPFGILESTSAPANSSPKLFSDPLDEIDKLSSSANTKANSSSTGGVVFDDVDPLDGFGNSAPSVSFEINREDAPSRTESTEDTTQSTFRTEPTGKSQKMPDENFQDFHDNIFDMPNISTSSRNFGDQMASPSYENVEFNETNSDAEMSPGSDVQLDSSDDAWLTVSEIPLFTQPTMAPPPSRPPPQVPGRHLKPETGFYHSNAGKKENEFSSSSSYSHYSQSPKPSRSTVKSNMASPIDELENFAMGGTKHDNGRYTDTRGSEEVDANSSAAASAAAMKEAMDRAEVKFRHAKEVREREHAKTSRNREPTQVEKDEQVMPDEQEEEERLQRERRHREEEEEKWRLERERERARVERERARQAVERATREARERAAIEARERAAAETRRKSEKSVVERVQAEARERATRAAVHRVQAEARERAAADAKEKAEKAAAEAKERANAEMRDKAAANARAEAEARRRAERAAVDRAAAEARERAASAARTSQQKKENAKMNQQQRNDNDLESFFSTNSRPSSAPRPRANASDPVKVGSEGPNRTSSVNASANLRKTSSATNFVDDLSSIFGGTSSSGDFQEVNGETEERRRARLDRHQRTQERAAKALAEKNQRDLQSQMDQEERNRIGGTLDIEIKRWAAGKEGNLRALLSTMQYVLWPECGWTPVSLTDLITGASVKKVYRKATLCIHPDKVQQKGANLQQKYIAEKVFDLLKEAWNKFNSEELF